MDRLDNRVRRGGQKAAHKVRSRDRFRLGPALTFEFGLDSGEGKQGPFSIQSEPHDILLARRRVRLRRILSKAVGRDKAPVLWFQPATPVR